MTFPLGSRVIPDADAEMRRRAAERQVPEHVREALDHAVTVVKPGETLIIRLDRNATLGQAQHYQEALDQIVKARGLPFTALVLLGEELAVGEAAR